MVFLLIFRGHLARAEIAGENSPEGCRIPKRSIILFLSHLVGNADKNTVLREGVAWFRWGAAYKPDPGQRRLGQIAGLRE